MKNTITEIPQKTFIITDIEATCDDQSNTQSNFKRELSEPIEIGAVAVNEKFEIVGEFQTFIKPLNYNTELTPFCMKLTKIKQSDVNDAPVYKDAYRSFEAWFMQYQNPEFCSWGRYDFSELRKFCERNGLEFHFKSGINLKNLFAKSHKIGREVGLGKALTMSGLHFIGTPHRGIDDAKNIARLLPYSYYNDKIQPQKI
jgi:inhibitor of KinA sporulation pathway (predicted exonuclease)